MFSTEPAKVVGSPSASPEASMREYHVCSSMSATWPSHSSVARLLARRYWPSPLFWSEYSHVVSTKGGNGCS
jgi:hypothetical protein